MSRMFIAAATTMAIVLAAPSASSSAASRQTRPSNCAPRQSVVVVADSHAEVFRYRSGVYACLRHGGSARYLGHAEGARGVCIAGEERCGVITEETLSGTAAAYVETRCEPSSCGPEQIVVRSVSTGRILHDAPLEVATGQDTEVQFAVVLRIVLKADGAVAWVQQDVYGVHDGGPGPPTVFDVFAIDRNGFHSLRTGLPAKPGSLKVLGSALSWTQEGARQAAVLK
jgi:hypothetical protein